MPKSRQSQSGARRRKSASATAARRRKSASTARRTRRRSRRAIQSGGWGQAAPITPN